MIDREKVVVVLQRRFPGSADQQIAAAANAIIGLDDEWVEVPLSHRDWDRDCRDGCLLRQLGGGEAVRIFRRAFNH